MAGKPLLRKLEQLIERSGGDAFILDQIADGLSVAKVARKIELPGHGPVSRGMLYDWRNRGGDERRKGWDLAMKASGHPLAEDAGEILEELAEGLAPSAPEVQLARARSNYKTWLAGIRNEAYAEKKSDIKVELNVGALHLDALRKRGHMDAVRAPEEVPTADYELLEEPK
jgi:transposase